MMAEGERNADVPTQQSRREESMAELVKELSRQTSTLVRQEVGLAKAEMAQKGKQAGIGVGMFGGAGAVGFLALAALTTCFIAALESVMALWLAALIVAIVYAAIAGVLAMAGKKEVQQAAPPVPEQTLDTLKEDAQWAKSQPRSDRT